MEGDGNCCWEYYQTARFGGKVVDVVGAHTPEFEPISVKKKICEAEGNGKYYNDY